MQPASSIKGGIARLVRGDTEAIEHAHNVYVGLDIKARQFVGVRRVTDFVHEFLDSHVRDSGPDAWEAHQCRKYVGHAPPHPYSAAVAGKLIPNQLAQRDKCRRHLCGVARTFWQATQRRFDVCFSHVCEATGFKVA
jgi:hypothetical protein